MPDGQVGKWSASSACCIEREWCLAFATRNAFDGAGTGAYLTESDVYRGGGREAEIFVPLGGECARQVPRKT